jgi:hypothetical protein
VYISPTLADMIFNFFNEEVLSVVSGNRYELIIRTDGKMNFQMSEGQSVTRDEREAQADGYLD